MDIAFDLLPDTNPLAPAGTQFALAGSTFTDRYDDVASPSGVRPFGLRRATPAGRA